MYTYVIFCAGSNCINVIETVLLIFKLYSHSNIKLISQVFDLNATGHMGLPDFQRMVCARHIIKYGLAEKDALTKLFQRHPSGVQLVKYDAARLSEVLATFRLQDPRTQSLHLLRDTM
jgi:hypothetical protein